MDRHLFGFDGEACRSVRGDCVAKGAWLLRWVGGCGCACAGCLVLLVAGWTFTIVACGAV